MMDLALQISNQGRFPEADRLFERARELVVASSDPLEKVVDYYKDKLGSGASVFQSDKSAVLSSTSSDNKNTVLVTVSADQSDAGQTKISIVHSKSS